MEKASYFIDQERKKKYKLTIQFHPFYRKEQEKPKWIDSRCTAEIDSKHLNYDNV